ncbi:MAG: MFS transporter [Anaerolineae bacterium]
MDKLVKAAVDSAPPPVSPEEVAAEIERHYRWNLAANLADGTAFWFAVSFISGGTILPLFVSKLTDSPLAIGLIAVISQGGWFLPQIVTARWIEGRPRVKPVVVRLGFFLERLPVWLLVLAPLLAPRSPGLALVIFFVAYAWRGLGGGAVGPAWQDLIARCFPVERRGRFLGIANFLGTGAGALGAGLSTWLLRNLEFARNFTYIFAIAAAGTTLSWFFISLTREPAQPLRPAKAGGRQFLDSLPRIVRQDGNFRHFLVARCLVALASLGSGFVTVAAIQRWQVSDSTVGLYTAANLVGQTAGYLGFGFLADRLGHKLPLELGTLALALAMLLAWLAPAPGWILVVFVLSGVYLSALIGSGILIALEFSGAERRPTYVGITNTTVGIVNVVAPLLGTALAAAGYGWTFAASALVGLVAWTSLHWGVQEPRHAGSSVSLPFE